MQWHDIDDIVASLDENYPDEEVETLTISDLEDMIIALPEYEESDIELRKDTLKAIKEAWVESR